MKNQKIYQFYAKLDDFKPKIWRRFQVSEDITIAMLAYTIMVLFEMEGTHPFAIEVPVGKNFLKRKNSDLPSSFKPNKNLIHRYELPNKEEDLFDHILNANEQSYDANQMILGDIITTPKEIMTVKYDFGDDWCVSLELEEIIVGKDAVAIKPPIVIEGEGYGIIEDCGGTVGLASIVKAFEKKEGFDYEDYVDWLGEEFDIKAFDLDSMNKKIKTFPKKFKEEYE